MIQTVEEHAPRFGIAPMCEVLGVPRSSVYRLGKADQKGGELTPRTKPPRALSEAEQALILGVLDSDRFADYAPVEVYSALLDEGLYLCSVRTMHRILDAHGQVKERRNQLRLFRHGFFESCIEVIHAY